MGKQSNTTEFIKKAREKHGDKYKYSRVEYIKSCDKVTIICQEHGEWQQRPNDHLMGCGCPGCKFDKLADMKRKGVLDFIAEAILVHGPIYNYSNVLYTNAITKVDIGCGEHGTFKQTPDKHLGGCGCPKCSHGISRGEKRIQKYFDENNVKYEREKRFDDLCGLTKNSRLRYDFYLPDYNTLLEYDGEQHFMPINVKGRLDELAIHVKHEATKVNDKKKNKYAKKNGYKLVRIPYTEYDRIENIISYFLTHET